MFEGQGLLRCTYSSSSGWDLLFFCRILSCRVPTKEAISIVEETGWRVVSVSRGIWLLVIALLGAIQTRCQQPNAALSSLAERRQPSW